MRRRGVKASKMGSILGDGSGPGGPGPSRCLLLLQRSLAIQLSRGPPPQILGTPRDRDSSKEHPADEMWMYDKGYNLFQVINNITLLYIFYHHTFVRFLFCQKIIKKSILEKLGRHVECTFPKNIKWRGTAQQRPKVLDSSYTVRELFFNKEL